jgi:hypothetical protein
MRYSLIALLAISAVSLTGCSHGAAGGSASVDRGVAAATAPSGILGALRPHADPAMVQKLHEEDQQRALAAQQAQAKLLEQQQQQQNDPNGLGGRVLPKVSTDPIAPPAEQVANDGPSFSPVENTPNTSSPAQIASAPSVATYGGNTFSSSTSVPSPPPGALGGGLVPPPPAVTLSTQANMGVAAAQSMYADPNASPYANPYLNPYGIPYQQQMAPQMMAPPQRPNGSPFGAPSANRPQQQPDNDDGMTPSERKKMANFVPIVPTGMEARSPYKQRDDLKVLWKGALSSGPLQSLASDGKFGDQLQKVDVSLPDGTTKGQVSISARTVDNIFRSQGVDRRVFGDVRKVQTDITQAYYRYLYTYNRFALAQQTLQARKQEVDVAGSAIEQQRAAADLSAAQQEADSTKDDMRQAQNDLASAAGTSAARTIITRVSNVAPDSLTASQPEQTGADRKNIGQEVLNVFNPFRSFGGGGGHKGGAPEAAPAEPAKVASADTSKKDSKKERKEDKQTKKHKDSTNNDKAGDLSPAPSAFKEQPAATASADAGATASAAPSSQDGISFELKAVNVTPRKSILSVSIRNSGANNFTFSPDVFSISEGNHKISEAAVRADFDSTLVQPNQEVKGTITIFGRPWNDKLAVVLSDGSHNIQLRR